MTPPSKRARLAPSVGSTTPTTSPYITSKPGFLSLEAYVSNLFYDAVIQDQDDVAEITYNRNWSRQVKELYVLLITILSSSFEVQTPSNKLPEITANP